MQPLAAETPSTAVYHPTTSSVKKSKKSEEPTLTASLRWGGEYRQIGTSSARGPGVELELGGTYYFMRRSLGLSLWGKSSVYDKLFGWERNPLRETLLGLKSSYGLRFSQFASLSFGLGLAGVGYTAKYAFDPGENIHQDRKYAPNNLSFHAQLGAALCLVKDRWCPLWLNGNYTPAAFHSVQLDAMGNEIPATRRSHAAWGYGGGLILGFDFGKWLDPAPQI